MNKIAVAWLLSVAILCPLFISSAAASKATVNEPQTITSSISAYGTAPVTWNLTRNGSEADISSYINGSLSDSGGTISFKEGGNYTLIASVTDATGRKFSKSASITVSSEPAFNCNFALSTASQHVSKTFVVTMDSLAYTGVKTITWSLTRSGVPVGYTGTLSNNGGSIKVDSPGSYSLKATITDKKGQEVTCTKTFTASNNAPNTPSITRSPNDPVVNKSEFIRITANASDPDGDSVTYVWENRPSEYYVYGLGTQTVRVKARDIWGAESAWAAITFTTAYLQTSEYTTFYYPSTEKIIYSPNSNVYMSSISFDYPWFNQRGGYTYKVTVDVFNKNTGLWEYQSVVNLSNEYDSWGKGLSSKVYTAVRLRYESNDPLLSSISLYITAKYHYP